MEDWESKPLKEVPIPIQNDVSSTFKIYEETLTKTNNFANVSTAGMDLSVAGNEDDINCRNKARNILVKERAVQRKKLKGTKKELVDAQSRQQSYVKVGKARRVGRSRYDLDV